MNRADGWVEWRPKNADGWAGAAGCNEQDAIADCVPMPCRHCVMKSENSTKIWRSEPEAS
jgi:hypothetical protein